MPERKAKSGVSAFLIIGIVFTCIGAGYLAVGIAVFLDGESAFFKLIFGGLGLVFFITGLICLFGEIEKRCRNNRLLCSGNYILAEIAEVVWCTNIRINGRHPYMVMCQYRDMEGNVHMFKSRYLNFDPEPLFKDRMVRIYVENENFRHYYVDIDEVLPKVIQH